jgi:hypothetical protein
MVASVIAASEDKLAAISEGGNGAVTTADVSDSLQQPAS